jgi:Uma2 family endonuclease
MASVIERTAPRRVRKRREFPNYIARRDNGRLMTPEEFDAVSDYDRNYRYELINGVLIVSPMSGPVETDPNEQLGFLLRLYQRDHPGVIDKTLFECYIPVRNGRRRADRVVWIGLGRVPNLKTDVPAIVVEFLSAGKRSWTRDYVDKRQQYRSVGVKEYWLFNRFERKLTVFRGEEDTAIGHDSTYTTPLLPGFELPVGQILACAEDWK